MVQNFDISKNNVFDSFPLYDVKQFSSVLNDKTNINLETDKYEISGKKSSKKKKILFGSTIASSIITAGVIGLVAAKGVHGSYFSKLNERLTYELQNTNLDTTKDLANKIVYYSKKATKTLLDKLNSLSNFTAIKDGLCDKIFKTNKVTSKFADGSKKGFKKVVNSTLSQKYDKVEIKVNDLTSLLKQYNIKNLSSLSETQKAANVTIKGTTKTLGEWLETLSSQTNKLEASYQEGFSLGARKLRDKKRSSLLSDVSKKVHERFFTNKGLFKPKNYKTYVTQDVSSAANKEIKDDILRAKKQVTNNISGIHDNVKAELSHFSDTVKPADKETRNSIQLLKQYLEKFKSCSGEKEAEARKQISTEISTIIDCCSDSIKTGGIYTEAEQADLLKQLGQIKQSVLSANTKSKGALEEIMTILKGLNSQNIDSTGKKIISDSEFKEFSKLSSKIRKGLDKATASEAGEYFLKQAELEVGSAPTDILSLVFPIGAGAYAVSKGDNKDEKVSAVLTTCLPLVGTFATFTYGTVKMLTGAKNLMFSLATGFVLKQFGNYCNNLYKKYKETGSVAEVAKGEYNELWKDISFEDKDVSKKTKSNKK
ncbi:MAG: hypothetical protein LUH05_08805 [Candidatus Gastranaerophilales bacterium]|nr:hypothetical protein [Candidatus Gastranaerophilales bacterium]